MSSTAAASTAALFSAKTNPKSVPKAFSVQSLSAPSSFSGLRKPFVSHVHRSLSCRSSDFKPRSLLVRASELPLVGNPAPGLRGSLAEAVYDQEFLKVKLSQYIGKKYVVLFFYPLDFTFVCPTEITAFRDRYNESEKLNTEIVGVSVDSVNGGLGDLKYPLVSDVTKSISKSYNVLIPDQEGVIQHSTINNRIGRSVDESETLRTLQAFQYVQENPDEVCPVGWNPGEKSMKPDPRLSKEYFAAI